MTVLHPHAKLGVFSSNVPLRLQHLRDLNGDGATRRRSLFVLLLVLAARVQILSKSRWTPFRQAVDTKAACPSRHVGERLRDPRRCSRAQSGD